MTRRPSAALALALAAALALPCTAARAQGETTIVMKAVDACGAGATAGQVRVTSTPYGLVFTPDLAGLPPGLHGFHVHENASCDTTEKDGQKTAAGAAGGHYDPAKSGHHGTPWGDGHLGDLPPLYVDAAGHARQPVLAPRLKLADLAGRALVVHAGGDNHADQPAPLGGGGARLFCGVIG